MACFDESLVFTRWHKGAALGVLGADFATTGKLSIRFLEGTPQINATITNQSACASGRAEIWLDNKSVWCQGLKPSTAQCGTGKRPPEPPPPPGSAGSIERVFIVFSTHLDVGYTLNQNGSCAGAVVNQWFEQLPNAIDTAEQFRRKQPQWRYQWMIHSWIASMFRHCAASGNVINIAGPGHPSDLVCPSAANLSAFQAGVRAVSHLRISIREFPLPHISKALLSMRTSRTPPATLLTAVATHFPLRSARVISVGTHSHSMASPRSTMPACSPPRLI
jgi:hypothetical protein